MRKKIFVLLGSIVLIIVAFSVWFNLNKDKHIQTTIVRKEYVKYAEKYAIKNNTDMTTFELLLVNLDMTNFEAVTKNENYTFGTTSLEENTEWVMNSLSNCSEVIEIGVTKKSDDESEIINIIINYNDSNTNMVILEYGYTGIEVIGFRKNKSIYSVRNDLIMNIYRDW